MFSKLEIRHVVVANRQRSNVVSFRSGQWSMVKGRCRIVVVKGQMSCRFVVVSSYRYLKYRDCFFKRDDKYFSLFHSIIQIKRSSH
jgi:hypothetical protein